MDTSATTTPPAAAAAPSSGPRTGGGLPRIPSLLFDMEIDDGERAAHITDEMELQLVEAELRRFLRTLSQELTDDVEEALKQAEVNGPVDVAALERVMAALQRKGYTVGLKRALGGGEGSLCLHNLRHIFLSVVCPGPDKTPFVVDPSFADQFRVAKPSGRYGSIMACVPSVLVLPEERIPPLVTFMCAELASSFKASGAVVPPWRQAASMLSKWQPRRSSLDDRVGAPVPVAAPAAEGRAHDVEDVQHERRRHQESAAAGADERAAQRRAVGQGVKAVVGRAMVSPIHIIKPAMEPSTVHWGFGAASLGHIVNLAS